MLHGYIHFSARRRNIDRHHLPGEKNQVIHCPLALLNYVPRPFFRPHSSLISTRLPVQRLSYNKTKFNSNALIPGVSLVRSSVIVWARVVL